MSKKLNLSPALADVMQRVREVGMHKTAAQLHGMKEVSFFEAVRVLGTKLAAESLRHTRVSEGLKALQTLQSKTAAPLSMARRAFYGGIAGGTVGGATGSVLGGLREEGDSLQGALYGAGLGLGAGALSGVTLGPLASGRFKNWADWLVKKNLDGAKAQNVPADALEKAKQLHRESVPIMAGALLGGAAAGIGGGYLSKERLSPFKDANLPTEYLDTVNQILAENPSYVQTSRGYQPIKNMGKYDFDLGERIPELPPGVPGAIPWNMYKQLRKNIYSPAQETPKVGSVQQVTKNVFNKVHHGVHKTHAGLHAVELPPKREPRERKETQLEQRLRSAR